MARKVKNRRQRRAAIRDGYRFGLPRMSRDEYAEYLRGKWWRQKRAQKLKSVGHKCESCGRRGGPLEVHHLHYCSLGKERNSDLQVLCKPCHMSRHPGWVDPAALSYDLRAAESHLDAIARQV
jgi:5-methylcytosine-specific restriction endonuclease McrA